MNTASETTRTNHIRVSSKSACLACEQQRLRRLELLGAGFDHDLLENLFDCAPHRVLEHRKPTDPVPLGQFGAGDREGKSFALNGEAFCFASVLNQLEVSDRFARTTG